MVVMTTILSGATGELDLFTGRNLRDRLGAAIRASDGPVIVDLSSVSLVDSASLATLLNARRRLARAKRGFAVVCPPGPGRRLFELTRLEGDLGVTGTLDEAMAAVAA